MQKYTCPMHPEVITDHPGNCPKCGMKLVPVKEKKRRTSNVQRSTSKVGAIDPNRPRHEHDHPPSVAAATYGAAGEHEHEKSLHDSGAQMDALHHRSRRSDEPRRFRHKLDPGFVADVRPHVHVRREHADVARRDFSALHQREHPTRR